MSPPVDFADSRGKRTRSLFALCSILFLGGAGRSDALEPMRTGMAEIGIRAWSVLRTDKSDRLVEQNMLGLSAARFLNDNISLGVEIATFLDGAPADSVVVDIRSRIYWFPLSRVTPWTELRGGAALGLPQGNAMRMGGALGLRWVPGCCSDHLAVDVQLVGVERWRQDWASEYVEEDKPSGRIEWSMVRAPWALSSSGAFGPASPLSWPIVGLVWLF